MKPVYLYPSQLTFHKICTPVSNSAEISQWVQKFLVGGRTHPCPQTQHAHISLISFGNQLKTTEV